MKTDNRHSDSYPSVANRYTPVDLNTPYRPAVIPASTPPALSRHPLTKPPSNLLSIIARHIPVATMLGRVQDWTFVWPGNIKCTLVLSIGEVSIATNRDYLPIEVQNGDWVHAKLLFDRGTGSSARLLKAVLVRRQSADPTTCWLPSAEHDRYSHMLRLRQLLSKLEPAVQAIFILAMASQQVERKFYRRIAALDHHVYPGSLLDQSVLAAELMYACHHVGPRDRDIAALVCLLYDVGKVSDDQIRPDRPRLALGMQPHPLTVAHLSPALNQIASFDPQLIATARDLLVPCSWVEWLRPPGIQPKLKHSCHDALQKSWHHKPPEGNSKRTGEIA
jgi:hypothetical protein